MVTLDKPRDKDLHTLSDFAEMLCLLTPDRVCARESIQDHIRDVGESRVSDDDLDDCFTNLQWRQLAFGVDYPFTVAADGRTFQAPEQLSERQKIYAFLLLCSGLPYTPAPYNPLTDAFERIALVALKSAWPPGATTRAFGKNETEYTGSKWQRINALAADIGGEGRCNEHTFRPRDQGDGGIDLVAWLNLDEHEPLNIPSALAQCACSRDGWSAKQTEISADRLGNAMHATHPWMQALFIPQCFRDSRGRWAVPGDIGQVVLFDRLRIVKQFPGNADWEAIQPPPLFAAFLAQRHELV